MKCIVNVAFGNRYVQGQMRLMNALRRVQRPGEELRTRFYTNGYPSNCPMHQEVPFAFKAFALEEASRVSEQLLWLDSCMVPLVPLDRIWEYIKEHGVWFGRNGFKNSEWTDETTLADLFPGVDRQTAKQLNSQVEHVVAGAFALDISHQNGAAFLQEYYRLASQTRAFCGTIHGPIGVCHRHDQTAASVICWKLGVPLTTSPDMFAYRGMEDERTVIVADGRI